MVLVVAVAVAVRLAVVHLEQVAWDPVVVVVWIPLVAHQRRLPLLVHLT